ncbi:MAG: anthranilate 1,2-dioxygenase [Ramlibacter sp.]|nr:anthranilate 1,2-dioxygenase [Ramlibacter sp.]
MTGADLIQLANELLADYAERIDEGRYDAWLELFAEEARYDVVPRENVEQGLPVSLILCSNKAQLRDRITALREANEYNLHYPRHLISSVRAKPGPDGSVEIGANYAVYQTNLEGQSRLFSVGRYQSRARLAGATLLLIEQRVIVDTFSVPTLLAAPL